MTSSETYVIHDNGSRPFKVTVGRRDNDLYDVNVYIQRWNQSTRVYDIDDEACYSAEISKVFIGKSPRISMTEFSGRYGQDFDGNTILVRIGLEHELQYDFIYQGIKRFRSLAPIVEFVSLVGNNDVPYPYAIDVFSNVYLLAENVIVLARQELEDCEDPYGYYYRNISRKLQNETEIEKFFINGIEHYLTFKPFPLEEYERFLERFGELSYMDRQRQVSIMTREFYVEIQEDYGMRKRLRSLSMLTLVPREAE